MARSPDIVKQRRWLDLIHRWQRSRLKVREFCQRQHVDETNFYVWRRVLRERGLLQDSPVPGTATSKAPAFVKLMVDAEPSSESNTASAVELVLSERRLLRVRPGFDADMLLELVRLLEEPSC